MKNTKDSQWHKNTTKITEDNIGQRQVDEWQRRTILNGRWPRTEDNKEWMKRRADVGVSVVWQRKDDGAKNGWRWADENCKIELGVAKTVGSRDFKDGG
jgi:hypothetical protein